MRLLPIAPFVLTLAAFILGFLCLFAGNTTSFMQDYPILTMNVSRIGQDLLPSSILDKRSPQILEGLASGLNSLQDAASEAEAIITNAIESKVDNITATVKGEVQELANNVATSIAKGLGLRDFYSVHVLNYCQGYYTPGPVKNATVKHIDRNVTSCRNSTADFAFNPTEALVANLNETVGGLLTPKRAQEILEALGWPQDLQSDIDDLKTAFKAQVVLYCIAIAFAFLTLLSCVFWLLRDGRMGPLANIVTASMAFLFMATASAISTAIAVKGADEINKRGNRIGVEGQKGSGFLGLTWAATACLFIAATLGCLGCFGVRKRSTKHHTGEKTAS